MTGNVLDAVRPLLPAIAGAAPDVDRRGAVDPGVIAGLQDAGVFSMLQPASFGGSQAEPDEYLAAVREVSTACTSTGWMAAMLGVAAWHCGLFDRRAQRDVWGSDARSLLCASYAPTGRLEPAGRGFRLSGRWSRCAGVHYASWLIVGALVVRDDGAAEDYAVALVPRTDCVVEPTWDGVGLRGISADDVVVSGAAVPGYRTFGWVSDDLRATLPPLYRIPQQTLYTQAGTAPVLGAARGLLAARHPKPTTPLTPMAMAQADLDLSVLQVRRDLTDLMDCARINANPDTELILRARRDQVIAFERATEAIRLFVREPGPGDDDERVERVWRDVQTAGMHAVNDVDWVLSVVGQSAFGMNVDDFLL